MFTRNLVVVCLVVAAGNVCLAQEPSKLTGPELFPDKSLAFVRLENAKQFRKDFDASSIGKMFNDPQLKPLANEFYGALVRTTEDRLSQFGMNLDELLSIPSGELSIALLPPRRPSRVNRQPDEERESPSEDGRRTMPTVAFLVDAGEDISGIRVMLQRLDRNQSGQAEHLQRNVDRLTLHSYINLESGDEQFAYFIDGGIFVAATDTRMIEDLALVWLRQAGNRKTLSQNPRYQAIVKRCVDVDGQRPHVSFYLDPLALMRAMTAQDMAASMMVAMLPPLGFDGFQAIGGSLVLAPTEFDAVLHVHLLLSNPRQAVLSMIKPKPGSIVPENWVPSTVATYATLNWDIQSALLGFERLYNQFSGEDALNRDIFRQAADQAGIDFRKDVIGQMEGRITYLQGFVRPIAADSQSNVIALRCKDIESIEARVLPKLAEWMGSQGEVKSEQIGTLKAYVARPKGQPPAESQPPLRNRRQETCLAVVDDYLIISDSRYMVEQIARTLDDKDDRLNQSLEFQLVRDRIQSQLKGVEASAITYTQPQQSLQTFYELVKDPEARQGLPQWNIPNMQIGRRRGMQSDETDAVREQMSQSNPLFGALNEALEKHELPPFSELSKHLAPRGGYLIEEENGLHFTAFALRRE